jgi:hypothetical protein
MVETIFCRDNARCFCDAPVVWSGLQLLSYDKFIREPIVTTPQVHSLQYIVCFKKQKFYICKNSLAYYNGGVEVANYDVLGSAAEGHC